MAQPTIDDLYREELLAIVKRIPEALMPEKEIALMHLNFMVRRASKLEEKSEVLWKQADKQKSPKKANPLIKKGNNLAKQYNSLMDKCLALKKEIEAKYGPLKGEEQKEC